MAQGHAIQISPSRTDVAALSAEVHEIARQGVAEQPIDEGAQNIDKIRDILFGSHIKEYETRFTHLDEKLTKGLAELREASNKRFDALEAYLRNELESLQGRLKAERDDRSNSFKLVTRDLGELGDRLNTKISELDEQVLQAQRQLRLELLQTSNSFAEDLARKQEEIVSLLDRRFQELRKEKTDRAALATLFTELGMRLTDEFHLPRAES